MGDEGVVDVRVDRVGVMDVHDGRARRDDGVERRVLVIEAARPLRVGLERMKGVPLGKRDFMGVPRFKS